MNEIELKTEIIEMITYLPRDGVAVILFIRDQMEKMSKEELVFLWEIFSR